MDMGTVYVTCFLVGVAVTMTAYFLWRGPQLPYLLGMYAGASGLAAVDVWRSRKSPK
jgi:hypothetical protein